MFFDQRVLLGFDVSFKRFLISILQNLGESFTRVNEFVHLHHNTFCVCVSVHKKSISFGRIGLCLFFTDCWADRLALRNVRVDHIGFDEMLLQDWGVTFKFFYSVSLLGCLRSFFVKFLQNLVSSPHWIFDACPSFAFRTVFGKWAVNVAIQIRFFAWVGSRKCQRHRHFFLRRFFRRCESWRFVSFLNNLSLSQRQVVVKLHYSFLICFLKSLLKPFSNTFLTELFFHVWDDWNDFTHVILEPFSFLQWLKSYWLSLNKIGRCASRNVQNSVWAFSLFSIYNDRPPHSCSPLC